GYREACSRLQGVPHYEPDPGWDLFVLHLLVLGPDGSADPPETVRLAATAITALSKEEAVWAQRDLGAALYLAGRFAEAVTRLEGNVRSRNDVPWDWAFLAMAHYRLGHIDEVRRWLDRFHNLSSSPNTAVSSPNELETEVLRREAETVVRRDPFFP